MIAGSENAIRYIIKLGGKPLCPDLIIQFLIPGESFLNPISPKY